MLRTGIGAAVLALLASPPAFGGAAVGGDAPEPTVSSWLNTRGPLTWKSLQGRLILVEKWRTT